MEAGEIKFPKAQCQMFLGKKPPKDSLLSWEVPEKIFSVFRHRKMMEKQEYICEL